MWLIGSKLAGLLSLVVTMQWLSNLNNVYYHTTSQLCVHGVVLVRLLLFLLLPTLVSLTISASASLTVSRPNKLISRAVHFTV